MKYTLLVLIASLGLIGCGSFKNNCHLGGQTCATLFGESDFDTQVRIDEAFDRIEATEASINSLQLQVNNQMTLINQLSVTSQNLQSQIDLNIAYEQYLLSLINSNSGNITTLQSNMSLVQSNLLNLQSQLNTTNTNVSNQQTQINNNISQLAVLNGYNNIVSIKDPCGDKSGVFDEVFLVLSTGEMLSSFSDNANGLNTRFSLLTPGSFVTTDSSSCKFTVVADPQPGKPKQVKITNEHY
jgi:hypothetical protein